jgi:hypothetical protein
LPDTTADSISLLNQAHVQYQNGTGESTVEKPAETQTSIWLASHLERLTPDLEEREFESPVRRELGALTKSEKILGGQVSPQYTYFVGKHVFEDHYVCTMLSWWYFYLPSRVFGLW